jgi:predicted N-acetyltransferase YhbS
MSQPQPGNENTAVVSRRLSSADLSAVSQLHALVFGPGRFARTAYRIREGSLPVSRFCRGRFLNAGLIAALRLTPVTIGASGPHLLLGPLAVSGEFAGQGHGRALVAEALAEAKSAGIGVVALVGDLSYYGHFGFARVTPGQIAFPGPVNPARILALELSTGTLASATGLVAADPYLD